MTRRPTTSTCGGGSQSSVLSEKACSSKTMMMTTRSSVCRKRVGDRKVAQFQISSVCGVNCSRPRLQHDPYLSLAFSHLREPAALADGCSNAMPPSFFAHPALLSNPFCLDKPCQLYFLLPKN